VNEVTVHLIHFGVQQNRSTVAANEVDRLRTGGENGWRKNRVFDAGGLRTLSIFVEDYP
jgi:hypothetical protein